MNRRLAGTLRRILVVAVATVAGFIGTVAIATPAEAAPPGCSLGSGHYEQAGSFITAYRYWFCDDGNDIPLNVSIQRYLSPGVYETVASGSGETTYFCSGTLFNRYRTTGSGDFDILCS
jgi:hypothetical protein